MRLALALTVYAAEILIQAVYIFSRFYVKYCPSHKITKVGWNQNSNFCRENGFVIVSFSPGKSHKLQLLSVDIGAPF